MSFCVAVQSLVFYVVSCTPYHNVRTHQRLKAQAEKERTEKARMQGQYPEMYQHPDPFNTNPYWSEEIMIGPHTDVRKYQSASAKTDSQKRLTSAGKEGHSVAGSSIHVGSTHLGSSPTVVPENETLSITTSYSDDWNHKRYQREDEELWGNDNISRVGHRVMDAIKQAGSSAGRRIEATLGMEPREITEEERREFYFAPRHPPVNDHHPPIVRQKPLHKDAHKWMLQPPPAAKIMEGKVPVSRTTSVASHMSRKTTSSDIHLSRRMHERAMEAKLKSGELPTDQDLTRRSAAFSTTTTMRGRSFSIESSEISEGLPPRKVTSRASRRKRRARPVVTAEEESSEDDAAFFELKSTESIATSSTTKAARRPKLPTVTSSESSDAQESSSKHVESKKSASTLSALPASQTAETLVADEAKTVKESPKTAAAITA